MLSERLPASPRLWQAWTAAITRKVRAKIRRSDAAIACSSLFICRRDFRLSIATAVAPQVPSSTDQIQRSEDK